MVESNFQVVRPFKVLPKRSMRDVTSKGVPYYDVLMVRSTEHGFQCAVRDNDGDLQWLWLKECKIENTNKSWARIKTSM